jgi:pimeloyl-ACP methyl ester carboxylesterase
LGSILIGIILFIVSFRIWRKKKIKNLQIEGKILETNLGSVEYWMKGKGSTLVMSHGGPGGYDQGKLISDLVNEGFQILSFSRPGYLQTPLVQKSIEEQADLLNALIEKLNISQIVIMGFSAGGSIAIAFANKYPEKTRGLILEAALSREYVPPDNVEGTIWEKIFLNSSVQDLMSYLMILSLKIMPKTTLKSMLKLETIMDESGINQFMSYIKKNPEEIRWYKKLLDSTSPLSIRNSGLQNDLNQYKELTPMDCSNIKCPTLIIHSRKDNDAKWKHAEHSISSIPQSQVLEVRGGHMMWIGPDSHRIREKRLNFIRKLE